MAVPTNTTAATAMVLPTYGDYTIPDVNLLPSPFELWFTFTTLDNEYVVGIHAHAPIASTYDPIFVVYDGTVDALNSIFAPSQQNRPGDPSVTPNTQYWIRVRQVGFVTPNAPLTLRFAGAPAGPVPVGSLLVPDVSTGGRMAAIDATTGQVLAFIPFPSGENGVVLSDGSLAMEDVSSNNVKFYTDPLTTAIATVVIDMNGLGQISSNSVEDAYYIARPNGVSPSSVTRVSATGVVGTTWTMPLVNLRGASVSPDESILYWIQTTSLANQPVRRYDLVNDTALSNLAPGIASTNFGRGVIVLDDGSIIISYRPSSGDQYLIRYSATGSVLNTYTRTVPATKTVDRVTKDLVAGQFWLWEQSATYHYFTLIRASDGVELRTLPPVPVTVDGEIQVTSDTAPMFGVSWSCPLMVSRSAFVVEPPTLPPPETPHPPPFCPCEPPPTDPPKLPPVTPPNPPPQEPTIGEQLTCLGGGDVPVQGDFPPQEMWWGL